MNLTRVTSSMRADQAATNLTAVSARLAKLTDQSTSGSKLTRVSDDPAAAAQAIAVRTAAAQTTQYQRNANDAAGWLSTGDTALSSANDTLASLRDLVVQASGVTSASTRTALSTQISALGQQLLGTANTTYAGRNIFAGTSDASAAFTSGDYSFTGVSSSTVSRRIGDDQSVRVDQDGSTIFGTGSTSVFALIDSIASGVASGSVPSNALSSIDSAIARVQSAEGSTGAAEKAVSTQQDALTTRANTLESQRSGLEDTDVATIAVQLQTQQVAYQAALLATSKIQSHSLMDYLS